MRVLVARSIAKEEILVRVLMHPFYFSSNKLKREAFMPRRNGNDVSTFRLKYTTAAWCKNKGKSINMRDNNYCGLAIVRVEDINQANNEPFTYDNGELVNVSVKATPLDYNNAYISEEADVYSDDNGGPSHADIFYNFTPTEGEPSPTAIRKVAEKIKKAARPFIDNHIERDEWLEGDLIFHDSY